MSDDADSLETATRRLVTWPSDSERLQSLLAVHYVDTEGAGEFVRNWAQKKTQQKTDAAGSIASTATESDTPDLPAGYVRTGIVTWQTDAEGDHAEADEITVDDLPEIMTV